MNTKNQSLIATLSKVDRGTLVVVGMLTLILIFGALNSVGIIKY